MSAPKKTKEYIKENSSIRIGMILGSPEGQYTDLDPYIVIKIEERDNLDLTKYDILYLTDLEFQTDLVFGCFVGDKILSA